MIIRLWNLPAAAGSSPAACISGSDFDFCSFKTTIVVCSVAVIHGAELPHRRAHFSSMPDI
jgi:hypothetical protein